MLELLSWKTAWPNSSLHVMAPTKDMLVLGRTKMRYEYTECAIMVFDIGRWEGFTIDSPVVWVGGNEPVVYSTWHVEAVFANGEA